MCDDEGRSRFHRVRRLSQRRDFDAVFRQPAVRLNRGSLWLAARPNTVGEPRLGMVVAKRVLKGAVARNRAKRMIRESFRQTTNLPAMDMVVRVVKKDTNVTVADADGLFAALAERSAALEEQE